MAFIQDISSIEVDEEAIKLVPESLARELCILPVAVRRHSLHIIHPTDSDPAYAIAKLNFILNRSVTVDECYREAITASIDTYYSAFRGNAGNVLLPDSIPSLSANSEFVFLGLIGKVEFVTDSSLSFSVGLSTDSIEHSDGTRTHIGKDRVFKIAGWLDVHYPCKGLHKLFVRGSLPSEYIAFAQMCEVITSVCEMLGLPEGVPYRITLESTDNSISMEDPPSGFISSG